MPITISDLNEAKVRLKSFVDSPEEKNTSTNAENYLKKIDQFLKKLQAFSQVNLKEERVDVNNFDAYFEGLTTYYKKCQQETIQFCKDLLQDIKKDAAYIKTPFPKKGSYSELLLQIEQDANAVLATSEYRMEIIKASEKNTGVPYCYRPEISYILKKNGVKRLYTHDKSILGLGKWYSDGNEMSPGETSGGLCYGTCINQFSDIKSKKSSTLPINTRIIGHQHLNQTKRKEGQYFTSNPISNTGKESFYTIAKRITENIESSDIYLINMKGVKFGAHAILIRKLPSNDTGFNYEFTDPNFGRLYFKNKEDFINALPMICLRYHTMFDSITLEKIYELQPILAPALVDFLKNQQNINSISLSDEWNAINEVKRSLNILNTLSPVLEKDIFLIHAFVSNSEAFRQSQVGLSVLDAIEEWDAYEQTVANMDKKVKLSKEDKRAMEPMPHYFDILKSLHAKYDGILDPKLAHRFEDVLKKELIKVVAAKNITEELRNISFRFKEIFQKSLIKIDKDDPLLTKLDQLDDLFFYSSNPELLAKYCYEMIVLLQNSVYQKEQFVEDFIQLKKMINLSVTVYKEQKNVLSSFIKISDLSKDTELEDYCKKINQKVNSSRASTVTFLKKTEDSQKPHTNENNLIYKKPKS